MAHRPTIMGTRHMVAACHYLASEAGFKILEAGGNAIDAGVATGIALSVVQPEYVNFAGVAPIIIYSAAEDRVFTIPGLGPWPKGDPARLLQEAPCWRYPARGSPHRGAGGAGCLDHCARALRHDELRRGRAVGDQLRTRWVSGLPADVGSHHRPRGGISDVSIKRPALSAEGASTEGRRDFRAEGACGHHSIYGRSGADSASSRTWRRPRRRPPGVLSRRHRTGDREVPEGERRLPLGRGSGGLSIGLR